MLNQVIANGIKASPILENEIESSIENIRTHLPKSAGRVFISIHPDPKKRDLYTVMIKTSGCSRVSVAKSTDTCLITALKEAQRKMIVLIHKLRKKNQRHRKWKTEKSLSYNWGL